MIIALLGNEVNVKTRQDSVCVYIMECVLFTEGHLGYGTVAPSPPKPW